MRTTVLVVARTQVQPLAGNALGMHNFHPVEETVESIHRRGDPCHHGRFVEEEIGIDDVFHLEEGLFYGGGAGEACEGVDQVGSVVVIVIVVVVVIAVAAACSCGGE